MTPLYLTSQQVRDVDRRAMEEYGMSGLVLMENAGRGCADVLCKLGITGPVAIVCGKGNNAGDGFVIARHLDLRGFAVKTLLCADAAHLKGDAATNYQIIRRAGLPIIPIADAAGGLDETALARELFGVDWIVDALLGTGSKGPPAPPIDRVIRHLNAARCRKLAVDLPSGLDCDSGQPAEATFRAEHTCTFVAAKIGFAHTAAAPYLGELHLLDVGAPKQLVESLRR